MAYYLRPERGEYGTLRRQDMTFVQSLPLVMHDACADANGVAGHPWDDGREAFGDLAGQPLCWSAVWSMSEDATPCYWCGSPVKGTG